MLKPVLWTIAIVVNAALPAAAQGTAANPLQSLCSGMLSQGGGRVSGDQERLCTCLVKETQGRLTRNEMIAYDEAAQAGKEPPPAVMEKVMGIASFCLGDAQGSSSR